MAYDKTTWQTGDVITEERLNHVENGIDTLDDSVTSMNSTITSLNGSITSMGSTITSLQSEVSGLSDDLEAMSAAVGSPLVASTVAGMTDTSKIYVYVGSETGYTSGNWYYYDGSAWTSGGVYNSMAVQTDKTLAVSDVAADAKVTGDEISNIKTDLTQLDSDLDAEVARAKAEEERLESLFTQPVEEAVNDWLDDHPEATTTVQNGSLTEIKFADSLKYKTVNNYVTPEMFGAVGDGEVDDTTALQEAFDYVGGHTDSVYLLIKNVYKITNRIEISGNGLFCIKGVDVNTSVIKCVGSTAGVTFYDSNGTIHELDVRDIQIRGDYTQTDALLKFKNVFNIYLSRVYTVNAGQNNYGYIFDNCGIISCNECLVVGSNDVTNHASYSNGILVKQCGSIFTFTGANFWNLNKALVFEGGIGQVNIRDNWIECVKSFVERSIKTGDSGYYANFNIEGNSISIHSYLNFAPSEVDIVKFITETGINIDGTVVNLSHNTIYIAPSESISIGGNSVVNIENEGALSGVFCIYFDGNIFAGKSLTTLGAYVFANATTSLYVDNVRIRSAKVIQRAEASRITDDMRLLSDVVPALLSNRTGVSIPSGVYLTDGSTNNDGKLGYATNAFYAYIGGSSYKMFDANTKLVKSKTKTATTGGTGNIALGTSASTEKIVSIVGDANAIYTPFIASGNNFVHVTARDGSDIANTEINLTYFYV